MAASYVAERKSGDITAGAFAFSPATNCTAGNTLALVIAHYVANTIGVTGVTDTKGNTWTIDQSVTVTGGQAVFICSTLQDVGTLTTSDTITVATTGSGTGAYWLEEFSGQYSKDVSTSATGTSGAGNTGTTAATADADEFAVVGLVAKKSGGGATWVWTKDANYTNFTTAPPVPTGSSTLSSAAHYRILSSTGTQICTDTVNQTSNAWGGAIVTYKVVAAGAATSLYPGLERRTARRRTLNRM